MLEECCSQRLSSLCISCALDRGGQGRGVERKRYPGNEFSVADVFVLGLIVSVVCSQRVSGQSCGSFQKPNCYHVRIQDS